MGDRDKEWEHHLRSLSSAARDSADPAADPSLLNSVSFFFFFVRSIFFSIIFAYVCGFDDFLGDLLIPLCGFCRSRGSVNSAKARNHKSWSLGFIHTSTNYFTAVLLRFRRLRPRTASFCWYLCLSSPFLVSRECMMQCHLIECNMNYCAFD